MENEKDEKNEVELIKLIGAKGSLFVGNASNIPVIFENACIFNLRDHAIT